MLHNSTRVFIIFVINRKFKVIPLEGSTTEWLSNNMHTDKYGTKKHTSNEFATKYIGRWMDDVLLILQVQQFPLTYLES